MWIKLLKHLKMSLLHHSSSAVCALICCSVKLDMNRIENGKWGNPLLPDFSADITVHVCQAALRVSASQQTRCRGDTGCIYLFQLGAGGEFEKLLKWPRFKSRPTHWCSHFPQATYCRCVFVGEELKHNSCKIIILTLQHKFIVLLFQQATKEKLSKLSFLLFLTLNNWNFIRVYWLFKQEWVKTLRIICFVFLSGFKLQPGWRLAVYVVTKKLSAFCCCVLIFSPDSCLFVF